MCTWVWKQGQLWMLFLGYHSPRFSWDSLSLAYFSNYNWFSNYARLADPGITYLMPISEITLICHCYWLCHQFWELKPRSSCCSLGKHSLPRLRYLLSHLLMYLFICQFKKVFSVCICLSCMCIWLCVQPQVRGQPQVLILAFCLLNYLDSFFFKIYFLVFSQQGFSMLPWLS